MIKVVTQEKGGKKIGETTVQCDKCGRGTHWQNENFKLLPRINTVKFLMRDQGWKMGRVHLCDYCAASPGGKNVDSN